MIFLFVKKNTRRFLQHATRLLKDQVADSAPASLWNTGLDPVYTTPEKFENGTLFLRWGLLFTLIRHEKLSFSKALLKPRNLVTSALRFIVEENILERPF